MSNPHTTNSADRGNRTERRVNPMLLVWAVLICLVLGLLIAGRVMVATHQTEPAQEESRQLDTVARSDLRSNKSADPNLETTSLVDDDGTTLWESPTDGPPLHLGFLPPGSQVIIALRPESLAGHSEGDLVYDSLGPLGFRVGQLLDGMLLNPSVIQSALIGCQATSDGNWTTTLIVKFSDGHSAREHLMKQIPNAIERRIGDETYWLAEAWAYYFPSVDESSFVAAPEHAIEEIIELDGSPPPLRRDVHRLLAHTDVERQVTILFAPNFLFGDGAGFFVDAIAGLRAPMFWFLGDDFSAVALSLHWDENFFVELAAIPTLDTSLERAAKILRERLAEIPEQIELHLASLQPQPYSQAVLARFPTMLRTMISYTRIEVEDRRVLMRCYLPVVAGHNLFAAAELTLEESINSSITIAEVTEPSDSTNKDFQSIEERLRRVISLQFARDTLDAALEQLSQQIGVEIVVQGNDLLNEGITRNQSFAIDLTNKPAEELLGEILRLANPDKSARGLSDVKQKLVYVIKQDQAADREQIVITTRAAAAERGDDLPAVFNWVP